MDCDRSPADHVRIHRLEQFLELTATAMPEKTALVCEQAPLTFMELEQESNRFARALCSQSIHRGDRVVIWLENCIEAVVAIWGTLKAGGVFVLLSNKQRPTRVNYILNDCQAAALVTYADSWESLRTFEPHQHLKTMCLLGGVAGRNNVVQNTPATAWEWQETSSFSSERPEKQTIDVDLAALVYTSGSTGRPKGVMLSHLNMISAASSITSYLKAKSSDVVISALPLSFDYGLYQVLMAAKCGVRLVLEKSFAFPTAYIQLCLREGATGLPVLPTMIGMLLQSGWLEHDWPSLRYITSTGAPLPIPYIRTLRSALPHVQIYSMYGLTECKRVSFLPPEEIDARPRSVGRGMPNEEVFIVDDHGGRAVPGQVGELAIRGSHVMLGYWGQPEETAQVIRPGRLPGDRVLLTGDLFRSDREGYLYYVGRKDGMIKSRGFRVSPREIEEVLYEIEGVAEALVEGIPHELFGQIIKATVACRTGAHLRKEQVLAHCRRHLEDFMVPSVVEFVTEIPKTDSGKLRRIGT